MSRCGVLVAALKARPRLLVWPAAVAAMAAVIALSLAILATGGAGIEPTSFQADVTPEQQEAALEFLARQYGRITILNQQSYPKVEGHWIVRFTTTGTHDLIITAVDGTSFGVATPGDIEFVELSAGKDDSIVKTSTLVEGDTITFPNYSSEKEGYLKLYIHTPGPHSLRFQFGSDVSYAHNTASVGLEQKISDTAGGFTATLDDSDLFGNSVAVIGDINNDGIPDIAVGAPFDDDGVGDDRGAVYILFMDADGTVDGFQKISNTAGDFTATLDLGDTFGSSIAVIGDIDNDGIQDLAVGASGDDDDGSSTGAVYILFMGVDGKVDGLQKISDTAGDFTATIDQFDFFGSSVAGIGDINKDGIEDIAVGAPCDDDGAGGGLNKGAVYILFMGIDGEVDGFQKISDTAGGFTATLNGSDLLAALSPE